MSLTVKRLKKVYKNAKTVEYDDSSRFIIMSDLHRGQGGNNDNFDRNRNLFCGALLYYIENGFTYIEAGDGDELWENRSMSKIVSANCDVFALLSKMYRKNRFYMLFGNHDGAKRRKTFTEKKLSQFYNDCVQKDIKLLPGINILSGIVLKHKKRGNEIFITHGHQGSILNDLLAPFAKFLVRYFWQPLEAMGVLEPSRAKGPMSDVEKLSGKLSEFAKSEKLMMICGHTHKPRFPKPDEGLYFNDGSCVHPGYITGIEIENDEISLVKWSVMLRKDRTLYVGREVIKGPEKIADYKVKC